MKDRFKFRAWDPIENKMFYDDEFGSLEGFFAHVENNEKWILMQCTRLKDRDGNLIFEGDVLDLAPTPNTKCHDGNKFYVIEYEGAWQVAHYEKTKAWNYLHLYAAQSEIIGNIYETPEI